MGTACVAFLRCVCGKLAVLRAFPPEHIGVQMEGSSKAGHLSGWQEEGMNKSTKVAYLSHQESGTPRGTMTKLPIMLLQVDKSSLTGVHMQESVLEDRFGIVHHIGASCCSLF